MTGPAPAVDPLAARIGRDAPIALDVVTRGRDERRTPVPDAVTSALVGAAREAVRNVQQHAGVAAATVAISRSRHGLTVEVVDRGVGIGDEMGFGVASSIVQRMRSVGGTAVLGPAPGGGTLVRLGWTRPPSPGSPAATYRDTVAALGGDALIVTMVGYLGAGALTLAGLYFTRNERVLPQAVAGVALLTATIAVVLLRRWVTARWWRLTGLATLAAALAFLQVWTADAGALLDFRSWGVGFAVVPLYAVAFYAPARAYPLLAGPCLAMLAGLAVHDPSLRTAALTGAFSAPVLVVFPSLVGALVRRSGRKATEQRLRLSAAEAAIARDDAIRSTLDEHLTLAREQILPWLDRLERGDLDHRDPQVRAEARLLMERARDDLDAPDFFDADLRRQVQSFRGRGGRLRIRPGSRRGSPGRDVGALLAWLTARAPDESRIVLTPGDDGSARVVVTPGLPAGAAEAAHGLGLSGSVRVTGDDFATAIVVDDPPE